MEGSVLSYVTDHNDAADDEDAHLGDCEASAIRGYPQSGASVAGPATPRSAADRATLVCRIHSVYDDKRFAGQECALFVEYFAEPMPGHRPGEVEF